MERWYEKYGRLNLFMTFLVAGSVICLITWISLRHSNNTFTWEECSFRWIKSNSGQAWLKDDEGNDIQVIIKEWMIDGYMKKISFEYMGEGKSYGQLRLSLLMKWRIC